MSNIVKIKDIYLCTGLHEDNNGNRHAFDYLTNNSIKFTHLAYWDPSQHQEIFDSFKTWHDAGNPDTGEFPILYYTAIDSDYNSSRVFLVGGEAILNSTIVELSKL